MPILPGINGTLYCVKDILVEPFPDCTREVAAGVIVNGSGEPEGIFVGNPIGGCWVQPWFTWDLRIDKSRLAHYLNKPICSSPVIYKNTQDLCKR